MVTIVSSDATDEKVKKAFFIVEPSGVQLKAIGDMLEDGRLRTVVDAVVPWVQAPQAYAGTVQRSHRGKVVIAVAETASL
jgi:NADPH:quinone reductase-like Zn-dependent oxidoreductase